jgi:hypothetical protein
VAEISTVTPVGPDADSLVPGAIADPGTVETGSCAAAVEVVDG